MATLSYTKQPAHFSSSAKTLQMGKHKQSKQEKHLQQHLQQQQAYCVPTYLHPYQSQTIARSNKLHAEGHYAMAMPPPQAIYASPLHLNYMTMGPELARLLKGPVNETASKPLYSNSGLRLNSSSHYESLLGTIERQAALNRPLCRCRVIYLGSSVPHITKNGLHGIQEPLRQLYPDESFSRGRLAELSAPKQTSQTTTIDLSHLSSSLGIDSWLSVWSNGLLLENVDEFGREVKRFFSIESLHYCAAVRYFDAASLAQPNGKQPPEMQKMATGEHHGHPENDSNNNNNGSVDAYANSAGAGGKCNEQPSDEITAADGEHEVDENLARKQEQRIDEQQENIRHPLNETTNLARRCKPVARFLPLDAPIFQCPAMVDASHPPVFAAIMRRTSGIKVLECHAFICRRDAASNALVRCCTHAYADSLAMRRASADLSSSFTVGDSLLASPPADRHTYAQPRPADSMSANSGPEDNYAVIGRHLQQQQQQQRRVPDAEWARDHQNQQATGRHRSKGYARSLFPDFQPTSGLNNCYMGKQRDFLCGQRCSQMSQSLDYLELASDNNNPGEAVGSPTVVYSLASKGKRHSRSMQELQWPRSAGGSMNSRRRSRSRRCSCADCLANGSQRKSQSGSHTSGGSMQRRRRASSRRSQDRRSLSVDRLPVVAQGELSANKQEAPQDGPLEQRLQASSQVEPLTGPNRLNSNPASLSGRSRRSDASSGRRTRRRSSGQKPELAAQMQHQSLIAGQQLYAAHAMFAPGQIPYLGAPAYMAPLMEAGGAPIYMPALYTGNPYAAHTLRRLSGGGGAAVAANAHPRFRCLSPPINYVLTSAATGAPPIVGHQHQHQQPLLVAQPQPPVVMNGEPAEKPAKRASWIKRLSLTMSAASSPIQQQQQAQSTRRQQNEQPKQRKRRSSLFAASLTLGRASKTAASQAKLAQQPAQC